MTRPMEQLRVADFRVTLVYSPVPVPTAVAATEAGGRLSRWKGA